MTAAPNFRRDYLYSRGACEANDIETIKRFLGDSCLSVEKTNEQDDKNGNDYRAILRRGAEILIDGKTRREGAKRYWNGEPDLALEIWSVMPDPKRCPNGKVGWTLDESKNTDLILFTYDKQDTSDVFLLPFQLLRIAFRSHVMYWRNQYQVAKQYNTTWVSQCVFVPISTVEQAIKTASRGKAIYISGLQLVMDIGEEKF